MGNDGQRPVVTIPQMERLWDFATGNAAQLAYLWAVDKFFDDAQIVVFANMICFLGDVPPGRYPHTLAMQWVEAKYSTCEVREFVRAGILEPPAMAPAKPLTLVK